jgi:DNA uptake protein ComE-like DNA-binding protein
LTTKRIISIEQPLIALGDVDPEEEIKILEFLNTVETAEEIARTVEFPDEPDIGMEVAEKILAKRNKIGSFSNLKEFMDVKGVGPKRFTELVSAVTGKYEVAEMERTFFKHLTAINPNYFGNLKDSSFEAVKMMANRTTYEELKCIGFNPRFERVEAVIHIKKPSGYGGNICSGGTPEYIRFYVDWDDTDMWEDLGVLSFRSCNIPGEKPLEYAVSIPLDAKKKWCTIENLPKVRAILSWNTPPPANTPDFVPVWGNSLDAYVQVDALRFVLLKDILELETINIPENILKLVDLEKEITLKEAEKLDLPKLLQLYKDKEVPGHRFGFSQINRLLDTDTPFPGQKVMEKSSKNISVATTVSLHNTLINAGFDISKIPDVIEKFVPLSVGDTTFEELKCIGLNTKLDELAGVIEIKRSNGYSGGLCTAGSDEYVAFWADWGDGTGWTYVGTSMVSVHDIKKIPSGGLRYSVHLPVNLTGRRQPCSEGSKVVKVRAILSWEAAPPVWDPNYIPRWGNRRDALIHIPPGPIVKKGDHTPYISVVGDMGIDDIDSATGLATGTAVMAAFAANESPFGGVVTICGHIAFPPDTLTGGGMSATPLKYRIFVRRSLPGETWQQLTNSFNVKLSEQIGSSFTDPYNYTQKLDSDGYYTYLEDLEGNERRFVEGYVLAKWITSSPMDGMWEICMEAFDPVTLTTYPALKADGTDQIIRVLIDNTWPIADLSITGYTRDGVTNPAEGCGSFRQGDIIHGAYSVKNHHFRSLNLWVEPMGPAAGGKLCVQSGNAPCTSGSIWSNPPWVTRSYPSPVGSSNGEDGVWSLKTEEMEPCGYIMRLQGSDRTIVDSGYIGHYSNKSVGFCLLKKG